jgi:hypothetical protein
VAERQGVRTVQTGVAAVIDAMAAKVDRDEQPAQKRKSEPSFWLGRLALALEPQKGEPFVSS